MSVSIEKPTTSGGTEDGYAYVEKQSKGHPDRDTFYMMGTDPANVSWTRERAGHIDGTVTGAVMDDKTLETVVGGLR